MLKLDKEVLTPSYIRKLCVKGSLPVVIATPFLLVFVVVLCLPLIVAAFATETYVRGAFCTAYLVGALYVLAVVFIRHFKRLRKMPKIPLVVIGKRIQPPKNAPESYVSNNRERYVFHFQHYGSYAISGNAYPDGLCDDLQAGDLYSSSLYGDEFYLVLDQDYKIILAYQCNYFEYTGHITQHVIVNGHIEKG